MRKFNFLWIGEEYKYSTNFYELGYTKVKLIDVTKSLAIVQLIELDDSKILVRVADLEPIAPPLAPLRELVKLFDYEREDV